MIALPPLPAIGSAHIEIFGAESEAARWDVAQWDVDTWAALGWHDVTPESMVAEIIWGADDPSGVLTVTAAGTWTVRTYDPDRLLDPSNGNSPFIGSLKPGRPMRITHVNPDTSEVRVVRTGLIDEITYNMKEKTGMLRGTDGISLMAAAKLPPDQQLDINMPYTLRARAAYLLEKGGLKHLVNIEGYSTGSLPEDYPTRVLQGSIAPLPSSYWKLGEDSGPLADSIAGFSGNVTGATTHNTTALAGVDGSITADALAGVQYGNIYSDPGLEWTVLCWTVWDGTGDSYLFDKVKARAAGGYTGWRCQIASNGELRILTMDPANGNSTTLISADKLVAGQKYHVGFSRDAAGMYIYINGTLVATGASGVPVVGADSTQQLRSLLNGSLDELGFWRNVRLTDEQISKLMGETFLDYDPPVGPPVESESSVWNHILNASYDALFAVWMDREATLRFRSFGNPIDNGFAIGGTDGIQVDNIELGSSLSNVFTHVVAYDMDDPETPVVSFDQSKSAIYGDIALRRQSPVPDAKAWADNVLLDRSGAALQYQPGTMYPQTVQHLYDILDLGMISIMHVRADEFGLDVPTRVLGCKITADTGTGWTTEVVSYIPAVEWEDAGSKPPIIPPNVPTQTVIRTYNCIRSTAVARNPQGASLGAGAGTRLPIGANNGWRYRTMLDFDEIDFSDVIEVEQCQLLATIATPQIIDAIGSSPKVVLQRITESWSEGGAVNFSGNNATVYPGPSRTSTGSSTQTTGTAPGTNMTMGCTNIAKAWHNGSKQYGIGIVSAGEDNEKYSTEWLPHENATVANRPSLRLTVKIPL